MKTPKQTLKELYQALADRPLDPKVDVRFYEPYVEKLPDGDPIERLFTGISFSDNESLHLVTGQRGTGKSTELLRLRNTLQDNGYVVFYINMLEYLHASEPVEITDFLISACIGLAREAEEKYGLNQLQESYWGRLQGFFKAIRLEKANIEAEALGVKFGIDLANNLRIDDVFKRRLQEASRGYIRQLVEDAHHFVMDLVNAVRAKLNQPDQQVAFIIDSFEQIRGHYGNAAQVHDSIVRMFTTYGRNLQLPMLHTVITIPPYLSSAAPNVARVLGSMPVISLPSIHVRKRQCAEVDEVGVRIMQQIVKRRSPEATEIFNDAGLRELAIASGGDLRDFFGLVRSTLVIAGTSLTVGLPIQFPVMHKAKEQLQRSMLPINDQAVQWLAKVHTTGQAELPESEKLPELAELFDNNLIINYRNGDDWYGIHPLVVDYVVERQKVLDEREADDRG
jgi:hypothetical protein